MAECEIFNIFSYREEDIARFSNLYYCTFKDIKNLFRHEKETKAIKDRTLRDIKNIFEYEKEEQENYYKSERVSNLWSNNNFSNRN